MGTDRVLIERVGVEGARPYGLGGNVPADAVVSARRPHGNGVPYISDVPFDQPYAERSTCSGHRTDGHACKAKARPGESTCDSHADQG